MKVKEIKHPQDVIRYIGNSESWLKAFLATQHTLSEGIHRINYCVFCLVKMNRHESCRDCPICGACDNYCSQGYDDTWALEYLRSHKDEILNWDKTHDNTKR